MKWVVSAIGYEGMPLCFKVEGKTSLECLRKIYQEALNYDREDMRELKEETPREDWDSEEYWREEIENLDPADFVLAYIFDIDQDQITYSVE